MIKTILKNLTITETKHENSILHDDNGRLTKGINLQFLFQPSRGDPTKVAFGHLQRKLSINKFFASNKGHFVAQICSFRVKVGKVSLLWGMKWVRKIGK